MKKTVLKHVLYMTRLFTIAFVIQCLTMSFILAKNGNAQVKSIEEVTVYLSLNEVKVEKAFKKLEKQTGYNFVFATREIKDLPPITFKSQGQSLYDILLEIATQAKVHFKQVDLNIHVKKSDKEQLVTIIENADVTVTGTVTDTNGEPIPGATVSVPGTTIGTATDLDGNYSLFVPEQSTLVFSFIGFATQSIVVGDQKMINVILNEDMAALDEVVVIGYGSQRSQDVTGSVATVSMENVENIPVAGFDQALSGQIAGLQISTSNGIPGGGPQVQLRGVGAIGAFSQPLYVVDGFALSSTSSQISNPMNDIAPQDILSITVLKDASATAIYGSRGANGVIIITTKEGASGESKIQISAYTGIQVIPQRADPNLMNAQEFAAFKKESISDQILANTGREATLDEIPEIFRNPEQLGEGTDWFEEITQVAATHNVNLSLSGGNDKIRTYVSAGYFKQEGVVISTGYERFSLRANVDADLSQKLKVGINISPTFSKRGRRITGGAGRGEQGFGEALVASPIPPVYNEDGTYNAMIQEDPGIFPYPNPLMALKETDDNTQSTRLLISAYGEYAILPNLKLRSTLNADQHEEQRDFFHPSTVGYLFQFPPTIPTALHATYGYLNLLNENTLTYQNSFGGGHAVTGLLGYSIQHETNRRSNFTGNDFPDDDVRTFNAAARITGSTSVEEWALLSYLARLNYSYKDKYLFTATIRRDGSSRFGEDNRWGNFPSLALGWHVSKESFMQNAGWFSNLKLRASYGRSGNFQIGNYTHMSQVVSSNYILGGSLVGGRRMNSLGNPILGWEKMREINLGLDIGFWNNRVYLTADFYKRNTEDLLLNTELPRSSGFSSAIENHGNIQNKGIELSISSSNMVRSNFTWHTDFNIAFNRNKVLALGSTDTPILAGRSYEGNPTNITMVGKPIGLFYGFVFDGIYQNQGEIDNGPSFPGAVPGNMRVKDVNGNGVINDIEDFEIIGSPYPDFMWGITNTFTYKSFDLRVSATSQVGGSRIRTNQFTTHLLDGLFNVSRDLIDRWRSPSNPGNGLVPTTNGTGYGRRMYRDINSLFVEDNTYFWIKNITLGYSLPDGIANGRIKNARFYASIQNGLLFTKFSGNPEVTSYVEGGSALAPGYDSNPFPVPVIYSLGANLTF